MERKRGRETGSSLERVCNDQQNSSAELEPSSSRRAGWYRGMSSKARRIMPGMPATTLLEESCSMTLHLDRLRPLWSMGVRLCAASMSRVRIPFDGSPTQGFAGLCAWDMGIMDYRVFLGVVWGFEIYIYIYISQEIIRKIIRYMRLIYRSWWEIWKKLY